MYIGHYKSVNSTEEFYTEKRDKLDFPSQVQLGNERYLLTRSIHATSASQEKMIIDSAKKYGIKYNVRVD